MLTRQEQRTLLVEWNDTKREYPKDKCIHRLFEEQVERAPNAVAVVYESQELTYRELNQRANQFAHYLKRLGAGCELLVGICMEPLVIGEVLRAFASRSRTRIVWELGLLSNLRLTAIAVLTIGLQIFSHHSGFLEGFLKTGALGWKGCLISLGLGAVPVTVLEVWKLARRRTAPPG